MSISRPQSEAVGDESDQSLTEQNRQARIPKESTGVIVSSDAGKSREVPIDAEESVQMLTIRAKLGLPDALKQKFLEPFTDQEKKELVRVFHESKKNPEAVLLFEKNIGGNINFVAYKAEARFGGEIFFRVMDGEMIKAQISFRPEKEDILDMVHREVQSQALGISGSSLLMKIDEYFKVLEQSKVLSPETTFSLEAGQVSVAQWALKNGHSFKDREQEQLFHAIISEQKNEEYIVTNIGDGTLFDSYIFRRDMYDLHKNEMDKDPTLAKKYSVRLSLAKKMTPVAEEIKAVPQPGESSGKVPLVNGLDSKLLRSESLTLEEIFSSSEIDQVSIPYYKDVYQDVQKGDLDWAVTKKVKEYADYLAENPETLGGLPPVQFLDNKLHDGAHRLSAIYLLSKLYPDSQWPAVKLKVDFYQGKIGK